MLLVITIVEVGHRKEIYES